MIHHTFVSRMTIAEIYQQFLTDLNLTTWYEYLAVFTGIASVWYSSRENILVYPVGLVNTIIYIYISVKGHLLGEATVNLYYTIMSIIGWYMWYKKDAKQKTILHISFSNGKEWLQHITFFLFFYASIFLALSFFKKGFFPGIIPWADAFASATAFTGMWLMTKKKVESWYWWIATNIASIPLYFVKHYVFTSVYYLILLIFAFWGLAEWKNKVKGNASFKKNTTK
ncbi:MAG: nicotinamide riboside transporter PnuC [Ferruginibacter sp.]